MKAVFLDFDTYYPRGLDVSGLEVAVDDFVFHGFSAPEDVVERIAGAEIVLTNKVVLSAEIIAQAPDLKLIVAGATGYNNIDVAAARGAGVSVCNVRGYSTPAVSQHVFMLILALRSQIMAYHADVKAGRWQESRDFCFLDYPIHELAGQTLGIVGYGNLGRSVEALAKTFGMEVLLADHKGLREVRGGRTPFDEVIARADVLTLHCPLTPETIDLIGAQELKAMKNSALLINTARGGVVNEEALASALKDGEIAGAGVDVLSQEPPSDGNSLLDPDILNLIVTPHVAWASRQACQRLFDQVVEVLEAYKSGALMNVVN
ncbi:MAG TPA: D-2-hydroxyacid dehydrogenase [Alphaproteobacteria bacterium]|nr:D-2-hydroxyacid dehydrogenase [Alphaproteobacteria bacterium]USO05483.1 MAG: D-2-hydroxyacid dehydrogenase [Rhodospirillales bacterium]HOO81492.1 D-2-hydroxyacid dehydrogenase [Alphaproteobacteria bacterium]